MKNQRLTIGIPKEIMEGECRVAATPETVSQMTGQGARVLIEQGAGTGSFFSDDEYLKAGAHIAENAAAAYGNADIILKVKEPLFSIAAGCHEIDLMKSGQYLITFLHPASPANHQMVRNLAEKGIISISLDSIPRITRAQSMDALTSMSTVAGYKSVLVGAELLPVFMPMIGTAVGMIPPAKVLVVGTGVAGLQALATAKRLGAEVYAADIRPDACEQAQSLGAKIIDLEVPGDIAVGRGGYANKLPESWLIHERERLSGITAQADIVILSALVPGKLAPVLINSNMVGGMKVGSVIVDIAIDQGGNCELSEGGKTIKTEGVTIVGTKNIPGMVPTSSTWMFSKNVYNLLSYILKDGKLNLDLNDEIISGALVTHNNQIVHAGALEAMNIPIGKN